jgi:hypothetical protein
MGLICTGLIRHVLFKKPGHAWKDSQIRL